MTLLALPLFDLMGKSLPLKQTVVLSWSGLRGAVGLSLALFIFLDEGITDQRFKALTFFHMGCMVVLTIILQEFTLKPLLKVVLIALYHCKCCNLFKVRQVLHF